MPRGCLGWGAIITLLLCVALFVAGQLAGEDEPPSPMVRMVGEIVLTDPVLCNLGATLKIEPEGQTETYVEYDETWPGDEPRSCKLLLNDDVHRADAYTFDILDGPTETVSRDEMEHVDLAGLPAIRIELRW